jgi:hypothetical protein
MKKRSRVVVGQWGMVGESQFAARSKAVNAGIEILKKQIDASTHPRLNVKWRTSWEDFLSRWAVERNSYPEWQDRMTLLRPTQRLDLFEANYNWWRNDFMRRTGVKVEIPAAIEPKQAELIPAELWWILAAGVVVFAWSSGRRG